MAQSIMILPDLSRLNYFIIRKELKKEKKTGKLLKSRDKNAQIHKPFFKVHKKKQEPVSLRKIPSLIPCDTISSRAVVWLVTEGYTAALDRFLMGSLLFLSHITMLTRIRTHTDKCIVIILKICG